MNTLPRRHVFAGLLANASVSSSRPFAEDAAESPAAGASAVTATEDLMREHGVLNRLMLGYEAAWRRRLPASRACMRRSTGQPR
jgi:hypothetical protein